MKFKRGLIKMDNALYQKLLRITPTLWYRIFEEFHQYGPNRDLFDQEWCHMKFYIRKDVEEENNGSSSQELKIKDRIISEMPNSRSLFYVSSGRFSLPNIPVAYFSDWLTATVESSLSFRNNENLKSADLNKYCKGSFDPGPETNKTCGYPNVYSISPDAKLLDLRNHTNKFFKVVACQSICGFYDLYENVVMNKSEACYGKTQAVAKVAFENNFDGIIYQSVRMPRDGEYNYIGGENIALFNKSKCKKRDYN